MRIHFGMFLISHYVSTFHGKYSPIQIRCSVSFNLTFPYILHFNLLSALRTTFCLSSFETVGGICTYLYKSFFFDHSFFYFFPRALFLVGDRSSFLEDWLDFYSINKYSHLIWLCYLLLWMLSITIFPFHQIRVVLFFMLPFQTQQFLYLQVYNFFQHWFHLLHILILMLDLYFLCRLKIVAELSFS